MSHSHSKWTDFPLIDNETAKKFSKSCLVSPGLAGVPTGYNGRETTKVPKMNNWDSMKDNPFFPKEKK